MGIEAAIADVKHKPFSGVPIHLRDTSYKGAKVFGHGKGYKYPHDFPGHYTPQQYLPDELKDTRYYHPGSLGREARLKETLENIRRLSGKEISPDKDGES